eukprot:COSAG05_NODE_416_length_10031_cov_18.951067_11_plen_85_part_00
MVIILAPSSGAEPMASRIDRASSGVVDPLLLFGRRTVRKIERGQPPRGRRVLVLVEAGGGIEGSPGTVRVAATGESAAALLTRT